MTPPIGSGAHAVALHHLEACWSDIDDDDPGSPLTPTAGAFCGCRDCEVRETLAAAWPVFLNDAAQIVELQGHDDAAAVLRAESIRSELH